MIQALGIQENKVSEGSPFSIKNMNKLIGKIKFYLHLVISILKQYPVGPAL